MAFTHLHLHTEYSLLDGAARINKVVKKAKELGMDSIAITDHGVMFGVIDFYKECQAQGLKPIIGCEVYMAKRTRFDKDVNYDKGQFHLVLLAKNNEGYKNLIKIVSKSFVEGFYYKPRVDKDLLREHSEGIIALSACLAGSIPRCLLDGNYAGAKKEAEDLIDIFGKENFFIEIQDQGLDEEKRIRENLIRLSKELGVWLVATNDVHYINREDAKAHDVLLCIQTGTTLSDENRMRFQNDQFYFKSEDEMRKIFSAIPEAIDNTQKIADMCNVSFTFGEYHIPEFKSPDGMSNDEHLRRLCYQGLQDRYGDEQSLGKEKYDELKSRLDYELDVIINMGYSGYFLIVWDFINYAKTHGIVVGPGRGSAAGSLAAYCLRITDIDPIKYNLIFERFLNPERVSMPDIDVDFCDDRRQEVIDYVVKKYGENNVSQIITFGTMKARAAIRDVGRVMDINYGDIDTIAKAVPQELKITLDKALAMNPELKARYDNEEMVRSVIDMAKAIEDMPRHASTHAAGVVISKKEIDEYVPLYLSDKGPATQFPMTTIEELGLLKMDFLGLRNLTIIREALNLIEENYGKKVKLDEMDYDDPEVYKLIASGNTQGMFQLESSGMTQFMKNLKPTCFEDIVAGISLYRPGPMDSIPKYIANKKNPENIKYVTDKLAPILDVTYGCLVYQEQVMQIVRDLGGYSYGRSDLVRRAMSKKKHDVMMEEKEYFINGKLDENGNVEIPGCIRNGVSKEAAESIFDDMVTFASYAFNKSHAAAYAVLAYQTAYLKRYYPKEFMAALMTSVMGDSAQIYKYIRNCNDMGIEILPPDINMSQKKFSVEEDKIRFGLMAIKGVGEGVIDSIIQSRSEKGKFKDLFHFIENIETDKINKKALENFIKAGAFDSLNTNRAALLQVHEELLDSAKNSAKREIPGQISLFNTSDENIKSKMEIIRFNLPDTKNFDKSQILALEKEMLGVYISGHPLEDYMDAMDKVVSSDELNNAEEGYSQIRDKQKITIGGVIQSKKTLITKSNQMMAFVNIEDLYGTIEVVVFPNTYEKYNSLLAEDMPVAIEGRVDFKDDEMPKILAETIKPLDKLGGKPIKVRLFDMKDETAAIETIKDILCNYPGDTDVLIYKKNGSIFKATGMFATEPCEELLDNLAGFLGDDNVKY